MTISLEASTFGAASLEEEIGKADQLVILRLDIAEAEALRERELVFALLARAHREHRPLGTDREADGCEGRREIHPEAGRETGRCREPWAPVDAERRRDHRRDLRGRTIG